MRYLFVCLLLFGKLGTSTAQKVEISPQDCKYDSAYILDYTNLLSLRLIRLAKYNDLLLKSIHDKHKGISFLPNNSETWGFGGRVCWCKKRIL